MHYVGHITLGPKWKLNVPVTHQGRPMEGHLHYMNDLYTKGKLLLGGPYPSGRGGIAVFVASSLDEAQALADADPANRAEVIRYDVEPLSAVFDAASSLNRHNTLANLMASTPLAGYADGEGG